MVGRSREEGALDVADDFEFAVDLFVGDLEFLLIDEVEGARPQRLACQIIMGMSLKGKCSAVWLRRTP